MGKPQPGGKQNPEKIRILCQRCGKEAYILFNASPRFPVVCIACRHLLMEEKGLELKKRRGQKRAEV